MKIGFIGLGTMGRHMASNLIKAGHELVVHDVRPEASAPHRKAGAGWAETPQEVAEATHVVFTSLPGPPEVEAVALGEQGLLAGFAAGKVYFDLTTNSLALVRRIHAVFAARGIQMLDAPVSGGPRGPRRGGSPFGSGATRQFSSATSRCSMPSAISLTMSVQSVRARSRSWSTTAPATSSRQRWPRSSRSVSRRASIRSRYGRRCARARSGGVARSRASSISSCRGGSSRRRSRYDWRTRTSRWRRASAASTRCPCGLRTSRSKR